MKIMLPPLFIVITILSLNSAYHAQAQDNAWFATGTTWTYFYEFNPILPVLPSAATIDFVITEQTELNGIACSKMDVPEGHDNPFPHFSVPAPYYFYQSNDSIFYASEYDPSFRLAYDFGAEPGDSWIFEAPIEYYDTVGSFAVTVDAVGTTVIDGEVLRTLDLSFTDLDPELWLLLDGFPSSMTVTERIGAPYFFFVPFGIPGPGGGAVVHGPWNITLQCYASPTMTYLNPDFASCFLSTTDAGSVAKLQVYPNPASSRLHISFANGHERIDHIELCDNLGRTVGDYSIAHSDGERLELNVNALPAGFYVIRVWSKGMTYSRKVVLGAK